jgi:hypothetical protein
VSPDLDLGGAKVTGSGLVHLRGLRQLGFLFLDGTQVNDAGLVYLRGFTQLRFLDLSNTKVTDEGVKQLLQALPHCAIGRGNFLYLWRRGRVIEIPGT